MTKLDDAIAATSDTQVLPEDIKLRLSEKAAGLARELAEKMLQALELKAQLTELHFRIRHLSFIELPDIFKTLELSRIGLSNGVNLELTPFFKASLPVKMNPEKKEEALTYLREHAPDIIKTDILCQYGPEEYEQAQRVIKLLKMAEIDPIVKEGVHHATLTAWVKEMFLKGEEVPFGKLNAQVGSYVALKLDAENAETLKKLSKLQVQVIATEVDDEES